jgi:hypothetical protein
MRIFQSERFLTIFNPGKIVCWIVLRFLGLNSRWVFGGFANHLNWCSAFLVISWSNLLVQALIEFSSYVAVQLFRLLIDFCTCLRGKVSYCVLRTWYRRIGCLAQRHSLVLLVGHQVGKHIALIRLLGCHSAFCLYWLDCGWEWTARCPYDWFWIKRDLAFELWLRVETF